MSTRQPSLLRKAISVLASFALAIAFVPIAWAAEGDNTVRVSVDSHTQWDFATDGAFSYPGGTMTISGAGFTGAEANVDVQVGTSITVTMTPNPGYQVTELRNNASPVSLAEGTGANSKLFTLTLQRGIDCSFEPVFDIVDPIGGGTGGGNENQNQSDNGKLRFACQSNAVTGGKIFYKLDGATSYSQVLEDSQKNEYSSIDLGSASSITIKLEVNNGYELDTVRGVNLSVNGTEKSQNKGENASSFLFESGRSFTLSELVGQGNTVSESTFELEFGWGTTGGGNPIVTPDPDNPNNPAPENQGKQGCLSFDNSDISGGSLSYAFGNGEAGDVTSWNSVKTTSYTKGQNWYLPIDLAEANGATTLFLKVQSAVGKQLDADKGVYLVDANRKNKLIINGTFNDDKQFSDKNGGAVQLPNIGLFDLYDSKTDTYCIPLELGANYMTEVRSMEFGWIDARTIKVAVDSASQYLLANRKVEIGIATGKGFKTTVEDGSNVSIPVLPDKDLEGKEERYLISLRVNPKYFIPYLVFNGQPCGTWDNGGGTNKYTNIGAEISASDFRGLFQNGSNTLTINLTVDKTLDVTQGSDSRINASFNMIEDGVAAGGADMAILDGAALTAAGARNDLNGQLPAYNITLSSGETSISEFATDISISVAGSYEGGVDYVVYREHEGQETQMLDATVDNSVLSFETSLFSKFSVAVKPTSPSAGGGTSGGGGSTPAPSESEKAPITNTGDDTSASTTVDVTDKVTTTETGSTQVAVDADLGTKIVENAVANKVTDVLIKAETSAGNSTATSVALPASTVKELAEKTEASVTISTDSAQVTLDKAAVAAVAEQAGDAGSVQLVVQTSEQNKDKVQIEVRLETSSGNVSDFRGGSVTISVPVTEELAAKKLVCVYIDENGKYTKMPGALSADGKSYVFATGHFSTYAVMAESEANAAIAEQEKAEAAAIAKAKPGTPNVKLSSPAKGKLTVKASAKKAKGYRVYYKKAGWKAYKTYTTSGTVKSLSKTFKKLSKGSYTVKVRAFGKTAAGKVVWGAKSKAKKVAVK